MDKPRIFVILVLILIALLFALGIGAGFFNDDGSTPKDERALKEVPDFVKDLGSLLSGLGPKLEAEDLIDVKSHAITIEPGAVLVTRVRASDDEDYRKATFRLIDTRDSSGRVQIRYQTSCVPPGLDKENEVERDPKDQKLELAYRVPRLESKDLCNDEDKACGKLTIFKCGGMLTFTCAGPSPCQVELRK